MADARGHLKRLRRGQTGICSVCALLAAWLALASAVTAQTSSAAIAFTVFSAKPVEDVAFVARANAAPTKLAFKPTARSVRYDYRGPMPLRFFDATTGAVVAEANLPANIRDALLLFTPIENAAAATGAASTLRYQIAVLDDSAARHGPGGLSIVNLSGLALTGTVNEQRVTLKPGLNPTLPVGRSAKITMSTVSKGRTYQSYARTATLGRNERVLLILFPPYYAGSFEVQSRLLLDQPPGSAPTPSVAPKLPTAPKKN